MMLFISYRFTYIYDKDDEIHSQIMVIHFNLIEFPMSDSNKKKILSTIKI